MNAPQSPSSPDPAPARPPRPPLLVRLLRKRVVIPLLIVLLPLAGVAAYRQSHLVGLPSIDEPFEPIVFDEAAFASPDNAFPDYEAAGKVFVDFYKPEVLGEDGSDVDALMRFEKESDRVLLEGWSFATEPVKRYVDLNRESVEHFRRGAAKPRYVRAPFWHPEGRKHYAADRAVWQCAWTALVASARAESEGDFVAAWETRRDALRAGRHVLHVADISNAGVSDNVFLSLPRWARDARVDAGLLRTALRDVDENLRGRDRPSDELRRRYWLSVSALDDDESRGVRALLAGRCKPGAFAADILACEPAVGHRCLRLYVENILPCVDRPLWEQPPILVPVPHGSRPLFDRDLHAAPVPSIEPRRLSVRIGESMHADTALVNIDLDYWPGRRRSNDARFLLGRVLLGAEIVRRETGRYPARIEDLVRDDLLKEVPRDPWSPTGAPLRYRVDDDGHVTIWSVGWDRSDDEGELYKYHTPGNWPVDLGTTSRPVPEEAFPLH